MNNDIEIARSIKMTPITEVAKKLGLSDNDIECYGNYKAKVTFNTLNRLLKSVNNKRGKLILVTAMTPTKAGEGKSTVSIGLADGLRAIGKNASVALREPSLGPCFGIKGGACGGGRAQIVPMDDINLHFTGDIHAITAANNLMAALIDNHIAQGNALNIDPRTITLTRCVDLNDRELRNCVVGLGGVANGVPRQENFCITVATEVMAIICLSKTIKELKTRISRVIIGNTYDKNPVTFGQLNCTGAIAALLKDTIRPNLVQTLYGTPAFVHGGPFANIAHGCNSINATLCALATSDYVVTEAGFGSDLGAEKFMDIKCRAAGIAPSAVVIVATIRALKLHGSYYNNINTSETANSENNNSDNDLLKKGFCNLRCHIENMRKFGVTPIVAINRFTQDTNEEISLLQEFCKNIDTRALVIESWGQGAAGAKDLAQNVVELTDDNKNTFKMLYDSTLTLKEKIEKIAKEIYRASSIEFSANVLKKIDAWQKDYGHYPICVAKTQYSISHDPKLLGAPSDYTFFVRDAKLSNGAGFVVVYAGDIMTMPGLPKNPAALDIDVDDDGVISGLF